MEKFSKNHFQKTRKRLYLTIGSISIAIVFLVLTITFFDLAKSDETGARAELINIAGRQRMLSQNLTKTTLLLQQDSLELTGLGSTRDSLLELFTASNQFLLQSSSTLRESESAIVRPALARLQPSFETLLNVLSASKRMTRKDLIELLDAEQQFLVIMDQVTKDYELVQISHVESLRKQKRNGAYLTILFVVLGTILKALISSRIINVYSNLLLAKSKDLQDAYNRLQAFFDTTHDFIYEIDKEGRFIYSNNRVLEGLGKSAEELKGEVVWDFVPEEFRAETIEHYHKIFKTKEVQNYHIFPIVDRKGGLMWIGQTIDFVYDETGYVEKAYAIAKDVSIEQEEKEAQRRYEESLEKINHLAFEKGLTLRQQLDTVLEIGANFLSEMQGSVSVINEDMIQMRAFYPDKLEDLGFDSIELNATYCSIPDAEQRLVAIEKMSASDYKEHECYKNWNLETYIGINYLVGEAQHGTIAFFSDRAREKPFTIYEKEFLNTLARWITVFIDRDNTKSQEKEERNLLTEFVNSAPASIAMFDTNMTYIAASAKWYDYYDIAVENIVGSQHYDLFPMLDEKRKAVHQQVLAGSIEKCEEDIILTKEGKKRWIKWEMRPWRDSLGDIGGLIMFTDDITVLKKQQIELQEEKEKAENLTKMKEAFFATMSHEIRTPLNAIIGTTSLLEYEQPELADNERLKMLKFGTSTLMGLVNDVLDYQKMEAGQFKLIEAPFDLRELCENIISSWKPVAQEKMVDVLLDFPENLSPNYHGDKVRLGQVLNNLLSNAIKFTEQGFVSLTVTKESEQIRFEVSDTGIGIPADKIDSIFNSYEQVNNQLNQRRGGSGLGLSICSRIMTLMKSSLSVQSTLNQGTKIAFEVSLPHVEKLEVVELPQGFDTSTLKILVADDNPANQAIACAFLEKWGAEVHTVANGEDAVDLVQELDFDLVLMDLQMPKMDGVSATKKIRALEGSKYDQLPIIALTASSKEEVSSMIYGTGMNGYVSKPFTPEQLLQAVKEYTKVSLEALSDSNEEVKYFKYLSNLLGVDDQGQLVEMAKYAIMEIKAGSDLLEKSLLHKDLQAVRKGLHHIRPNLTYLDLQEIAKNLPELEDEEIFDKIPSELATIKHALSEVESRLQEF